LVIRDHNRVLLRQVPILRKDQRHYKIELPYVKVHHYLTSHARIIDPDMHCQQNRYPSLSTVLWDFLLTRYPSLSVTPCGDWMEFVWLNREEDDVRRWIFAPRRC
jgi:hypothetical protein